MYQENAALKTQQVALEEYRALRSEILTRLNVQQRLTEFGLLLFAVLLGASAYVVLTNPLNYQNAAAISSLLLIVSFPFGLLLWAYQEQNLFIALVGNYLNKELKPVLELGWESFLSERRLLLHDLVTSSRFFFLLIAAIIPIVMAVVIISKFDQPFSVLSCILLAMNIVIVLGGIWLRVKSVQSFKKI